MTAKLTDAIKASFGEWEPPQGGVGSPQFATFEAGYRAALAAQLHIEKLREALKTCHGYDHEDVYFVQEFNGEKVVEALSTQPDLSTLEAEHQRVAEACAKVCDAHNDFYRNGIVCAEKIRAGQWRKYLGL